MGLLKSSRRPQGPAQVVDLWDKPSVDGDVRYVLYSDGTVRIKAWDGHGSRTPAATMPAWLGRLRHRKVLRAFRQANIVTA